MNVGGGTPGRYVLDTRMIYADALAVARDGKGVTFKLPSARSFDSMRSSIARLARFDGNRAHFQRTSGDRVILWIDLMPSGQRSRE